jgi:tetratricopeptide (TPR) repeat protein
LVGQKRFEALVTQLLPALYRYCEMHAKSTELLQLVDQALEAMDGSGDGTADSLPLVILLTVQASFYRKGDPVRLDRYDILLPPAYEENIHRVGALAVNFEVLKAMGLWGTLFAYLYGRFVDGETAHLYLQQLIDYYRELDQPWELAFTLQMSGCLDLYLSLNANQKETYLNEAGQHLKEALSIFQRLGDEREYGHTLLWLGDYNYRQHRLEEAVSAWQVAQAKFDEIGDIIVSIHWLLGDLFFHSGKYEAAFQYYSEIQKKYTERGYKRIAAYGLSRESIEALRYSEIEHARRTREQSLQLSQEVEDRFGEAWCVWEMGEILRVAGDHSAARSWFERARDMFEDVQEVNGAIFYYRGLGDIALEQGAYSEAYQQFQLSLEHGRRVDYKWGSAYALVGLGRAAVGLGQCDEARMHLTEGLQTVVATGDYGLALFALAGCVQLYFATGEDELAVEVGTLVSEHFASWRETKAQVTNLLSSVKDLPSQRLAAAQERGRQADAWDVIDRLLKNSLR